MHSPGYPLRSLRPDLAAIDRHFHFSCRFRHVPPPILMEMTAAPQKNGPPTGDPHPIPEL